MVWRPAPLMQPTGEPPLLDPRRGDAEDDASSPKRRSLLAIAGSLLAEISLPKLLFAWTFSILLPALLLGLAPLIATAWLLKVSRAAAQITGLGTVFVLLAIVALGWFGWRPLLRVAEINFWSLNALAIQPVYAFCREALRYVTERMLSADAGSAARARLRAISSAAAAIIVCLIALLIAAAVWPASRWVGTAGDLLDVRSLILPTLANAVVVVCTYLAVASLVWGFADALMDSRPISALSMPPPAARPGGSRICRTFTSSASNTAFASKAGAAGRAAMAASRASCSASRPSIKQARSTSC